VIALVKLVQFVKVAVGRVAVIIVIDVMVIAHLVKGQGSID
jgi:hypothetical protein